MKSTIHPLFGTLVLVTVSLLLTGCDLGTYGKRLEANGPNYKYGAEPDTNALSDADTKTEGESNP